MFPSGGVLVKLLATVAAFLTATSGAPRVRCVCPDGRVKLFCPGPASGYCCDNLPAPGRVQGEQGHRRPAAAPACCTHANPTTCARPDGGEQTPAVTPCGCQQTLVIALLAYTTEDAGDSDRFEAALVAWVKHTAPARQVARAAWSRERFLLPPPDRVVLFCHFNC